MLRANAKCEPAFSDWAQLLPDSPRRGLLAAEEVIDVTAFRKKLLGAALRFQDRLIEIGRETGIPTAVLEGVREDVSSTEQVVAASGHQPIIYHPGLLEKNVRLSQFTKEHGCLGLNIIIDTDDSDGGLLRYPARAGKGLALREVKLAPDRQIFLSARLSNAPAIAAALGETAEGLRSSGRDAALQKFGKARDAYQRLADTPVIFAHTLVRALFEPERNYLEIPFSWLLKEEEVKNIFTTVLRRGRSFMELYNDTLHRHRVAHRIENPANPFPDLKYSSQEYELPLWIVDERAGTRTVLQVREEEPGKLVFSGFEELGAFERNDAARIFDLLGPGKFMAPRGSLITLLLRTLCSDLFIHGLGGGHYDTFTETFAGRWLQLQLSPFVLATATRHLFESEIEEYERLNHWKSSIKDIYSHTRNYLGQKVFPPEVEHELKTLSDERAEAVAKLAAGVGKEERRPVLLRLNDINRRIKDLINATEWYSRIQDLEVDQSTLQAWYCREYPFFFCS